MNFEKKQEDRFRYIEAGKGKVIILLHGLFGALSNFSDVLTYFKDNYKIVIPLLPIYELPFRQAHINRLVEYVKEFVNFKGYTDITILGNSLGGHIALLYTLQNQANIHTLILTGSSGLFENAFGDTYPQRKNYEFIRKKTEFTFYKPEMATKQLVDEVFNIVNDRNKALCVVAVAKSAIRNNIQEHLPSIKVPTLLIWGKQDNVTPPFVAKEFQRLLPNAQLFFIDKCGHAPMMEQPTVFNELLAQFLKLYCEH